MAEFWRNSGFQLLSHGEDGFLKLSGDFLRAYRDIHAATMQINLAWDRHAISAAEMQLGLPPTDPRA